MAGSADLIIVTLGIIICIVSIIGNALVCAIIIRVKSMKTQMNKVLLNLAVLDIIFGFLTIFFVLKNDISKELGLSIMEQAYNTSITIADGLCKAEAFTWIGTSVSPLLLTAMAYERHQAIVYPLSNLNQQRTGSRLKWILAFSWVYGLTIAGFDIAMTSGYNNTTNTCAHSDHPWLMYGVYDIVYAILSYMIPSIAISIFYFRVIKVLYREDKALSNQAEAQRLRLKSRRKVVTMILLVTVVFYICCVFPHVLFSIDSNFYNSLSNKETWKLLLYITFALIPVNSAFNPFVYFWFLKSFRDGFKTIFGIKQRSVEGIQNHVNFSREHFSNTTMNGRNVTDNREGPRLVSLRLLEHDN